MLTSPHSHLLAIADKTRLRLLTLIGALPGICVCQLIEVLQMQQGTISKALLVLRKIGLVEFKREKQWVRYWLAPSDQNFPLTAILAWAAKDAVIANDLNQLHAIRHIPLDRICCNKPWRMKT